MTSAGVQREAITGEMKRLTFLTVSQVAGGGQKAMIWSTRTGTQCACHTQTQELHMHKGAMFPQNKQALRALPRSGSWVWRCFCLWSRGEKDHFGILGEGLGKATGSHCVLQGEGN